MGFVYEDGKNYNRPGVYRKSSNGDTNTAITSAIDGVGALTISSDWGPLNEVTVHYAATSNATIKNTYGDKGTTKVADAYMLGGLNTLYLIRVGNGGTKGISILKVDETDAVTLTLKYPGKHEFTVSVHDKIGSSTERELVVYDGAKAVETIAFATSENEVETLVNAVGTIGSDYILATAIEGVTGSISPVAQQKFEGGTNPTVTAEDYVNAFEELQPYYYNTIAIDTVDSDVQALLKEYINTTFDDGNIGIGIIGESGTVPFARRMENASKQDDYKIIYFGSDYINSDGKVITGAEAIATVAGVIASTPSNESIVHKVMPGAATVAERLKNSQYEDAINHGLLLLSINSDGNVVFDSGVNTLLHPTSNQDDGWKKIKRAKVRHETFYRLDSEMDKLIGKINGTKDGIANVIQRGQAVLDTMAREQKLIEPTFTIDEEKGYGADYAYFIIDAVDVDTLERIFLNYKFKYSENS